MSVVILVAITIVLFMATLSLMKELLSFLWKVSPAIVFMACCVAYTYYSGGFERKDPNAEYSRLLEDTGNGSGYSKERNNDEVSPSTSPGSKTK